MSGILPGFPQLTSLTGSEIITVDTGNTQGINPETGYVTPDQLLSYAPPSVAIAYAATVTPDLSDGNVFVIGTLTGNVTIANPTNLVDGKTFRMLVTQDGTGSRTITLGNKFLKVGTPSTTASYIDLWTCTYVESKDKIYAIVSPNFA